MSDLTDSLAKDIPALRAFARTLVASRTAADDLVAACLKDAVEWSAARDGAADIKIRLFRHLYRLFCRRHFDESALPSFSGSVAMPADGESTRDVGVGRVEAALQDLPYEWRAALALIIMQGLRADEAGKILDIPAVAARDRARRGQLMLKEILYGDLISWRGQAGRKKPGNPPGDGEER